MKEDDVIIVRIWEGLGNQLFQYAYARALAAKGHKVKLDLKKAYDDIYSKEKGHDVRCNSIQNFNISLEEIDVEEYEKYQYIKRDSIKNRIIFCMAKLGFWKYKYHEENGKGYSKNRYSVKSRNVRRNCYVKGWFQDIRFFEHIRKVLLKEFTPKKKIKISTYLRDVLECEESVSVHVRRGDYVKIRQTLSNAYYKKAATYMREYYKNPRFLIFSDDIKWVKENLDIGGNCIYINENGRLQDYEELFIMSRCKSNIISNSTFSWWGSWLNCNPNKIVIAPQNCWLPRQKNMLYL